MSGEKEYQEKMKSQFRSEAGKTTISGLPINDRLAIVEHARNLMKIPIALVHSYSLSMPSCAARIPVRFLT